MFTRVPSDFRPSRRRRPLRIILMVGVAIYLVLTALGTLWTDYLWFESIGYQAVWLRRWGMSILLGALGIAVSFLVLWLGLKLVDRFSPRWTPFELTEEEELIERFREWVEPRIRQLRLGLAAGLSLIFGLTAATWRDDVFLFMNAQDFGTPEPIFDRDIGFYVFRIPLWETAFDWVFNLLVLSMVIVIVAHYFNGGIRFNGRRLSTTRGAKIHVSVMLALIAVVRAAVYRLDMFELMLTDRSGAAFFGPGFADVMARLPAFRLLILVALVAAALFVANIFRQGWTLSAVAVGSWIIVAVAAGAIYPVIIQRFQVTPSALEKETPYIEHNLAFTRAAWGLDRVEVRGFSATDNLSADDIEANRLTIDNLRMWNTSVLPRTYQNFQELRPYYTLSFVDTDRYLNDGIPTQMMLAVRELEEGNLPRDDWQNERLFYTHGVGAVVNEGNVVGSGGQPEFLLQDVPPVAAVADLNLEEPRIYFGETYAPGRPVIVKTGSAPQEIDFPLPGEGSTQKNEYAGAAGVELNSFWKRIAFAFRYRDLNLLISPEIRPDSRVLVERNIRQISERVASFMYVDTDPYPVIIDGKVLWVLDLYTASKHYPYSQPLTNAAIGRLAQSSNLRSGINYMRNSVKVVIDAHDGDVTFYLFDPSDPVVQAWSDVYPGLFTPQSEMPDGLIDHLRYPQDLFRVQGQLYLEYHVDDPTELFTGNDAWSLPADPSTISRGRSAGLELLFGDLAGPPGDVRYRAEILPYYLLTKLPGEDDLSYLLLQPFTPRDKRNMAGFLVADSTPGRYGRLVDFRMPQGELVDGTEQVGQRIEQDAEIAEQLSLWRGRGSDVIKGDLLVVPIEDSLIYIQPIFLEEEGGSFPEFRRAAVVFGDQVEWAETLDGALALIFGDETRQVEPSTPDGATVEELLNQAANAFTAADEALKTGDLAEYQRQVEEAQRLIEEAQSILAGAVETRFGATG